MTPQQVPTLEELRALGMLREVDLHFARAAARIAGEDDPLVLLGLAVASRAPGAGHVCADLRDAARVVRLEDGERAAAVRWPHPDAWIARMLASDVVAVPGNESARRPLVLDGARLYLDRYWRYQLQLARAIESRARTERTDVDLALLKQGLDRLFPARGGEPDRQRIAACVAVLRELAIVTGGPGTGKTTTVVRVLALLIEQALARGAELRIALAAPTGKAAARMADAIRAGMQSLDVSEDVRRRIPDAASTLHRLLRWRPSTPTTFHHGPDRPLAVDVVVVDEVSMVDLALMAKLVSAVRDGARLVLLGDRDQLASVEAGAILGDICPDDAPAYSARFSARLRDLAGALPDADDKAGRDGLRDCVTRLTVSHRFRGDGGIGALARAINAGDADAACARCASEETAMCEPGVQGAELAPVRARVVDGYREFLSASDPAAALEALDRFRVLCAHRSGPLGSVAVNETVARWCETEGLLDRRGASEGGWYHRRPIIVVENDYALELFNGDTGVIMLGEDGRPRAWFRAAGGGIRSVNPNRLPAHETVFAMTVHKSQGSEFERVLLVLPQRPSPVLTRELLYTAITRARRAVTIVGTPEIVRAAVSERVQRASGLRERLWSAPLVATTANGATNQPSAERPAPSATL